MLYVKIDLFNIITNISKSQILRSQNHSTYFALFFVPFVIVYLRKSVCSIFNEPKAPVRDNIKTTQRFSTNIMFIILVLVTPKKHENFGTLSMIRIETALFFTLICCVQLR